MRLSSSQLYMAACNIYANRKEIDFRQAISDAKAIASIINEEPNVTPLQEVEDAVRFIITKYNRPVSKYTISSLLQGEFGYSKGDSDAMVDRCEFHGFIVNISEDSKSLYELKERLKKP